MKVQENTWSKETGWFKPAEDFSKAQLVFYFGNRSIMESKDHFEAIRALYPQAQIVGCSSGGEIQGQKIFDDAVVVTAVQFEGTPIKTAKARVSSSAESALAGKEIGEQLNGDKLSGILVLSDGLNVNGSELVKGIISVVGPDVPVTGGLAGDGDRFKKTLVSANEAPQSNMVSAVGFYGERVVFGHGCLGGWDAFGPERLITKSKGNVLYEMDGQPALTLYKKYLGEEAANLPGSALLFPLTIRPANNKNYTIVRTILSVNEADQSMTFAGDVPEGYVAQLMRGNFDHLVDGAAQAAKSAKLSQAQGDKLAVLVSCIGRKLLMGQRVGDEVEAVSKELGQDFKQVGFYSYGEISPHEESGFCELHNQTMTITTIGEK